MNDSYGFSGDGKSWKGKFPSRNIAIAYAEHNNKPCIATALNGPRGPERVVSVQKDTAVVAADLALKAANDELTRCAARISELETEVAKLERLLKPTPAPPFRKVEPVTPQPFKKPEEVKAPAKKKKATKKKR